jgi:hypothetical protein
MSYVVTITCGGVELEVVVGAGVGVGGGGDSGVDVTVTTGGGLDFTAVGELEDKGVENELGTEGEEIEVKVVCDVEIIVDEWGNNVVGEGVEKVFDTDEVGDVCDGFCDDVGGGGDVDVGVGSGGGVDVGGGGGVDVDDEGDGRWEDAVGDVLLGVVVEVLR